MSVFKLFFKILRENIVSFLMYLGIFLFIFSMASKQIDQADLDSSRVMTTAPTIVIIDHDKTPISQHFTDYLYDKNIKSDMELEETTVAFNDAIFGNQIDYILVIPEGFTESLKDDSEHLMLDTYPSAKESTTTLMDDMIVEYVANWNTVAWTFGGDPQGEDLTLALERLDEINDVEVESSVIVEDQLKEVLFLQYYLMYIDYIIIALAFSLVGNPVVAIEEPLMKRRDVVSGNSNRSRSIQLFSASYLVVFLTWLIFVIFSFLFVDSTIYISQMGIKMLLSSFVHMLAMTSFALFLCHLFPDKGAVSFFSTLVSLLLAFSSGIFVPASILWEPFHKFSSLFPTYWDVNNQNIVYPITVSDGSFAPYYQGLAIMVGMAVLYFILTLIQRQLKSREVNLG